MRARSDHLHAERARGREKESASGVMSGAGGRDLGGWRKSGDRVGQGGRTGRSAVGIRRDGVESSRVCGTWGGKGKAVKRRETLGRERRGPMVTVEAMRRRDGGGQR